MLLLGVYCNGFQCTRDPLTGESRCFIPADLKMCQDFAIYTACLTEVSVAQQELLVAERMKKIQKLYGVLPEICTQSILEFQCAVVFPACELEEKAELVCASECDVVKTACNDSLSDDAYEVICERGYLEDEETCFLLGYAGASYYLWAIGLSLAVGFSFFNSIALNLQKLSLNRHGEDVMVLKQPLWVMGFLLLLTGSIMDFVAFGLAPASLLAPLAALSLVWNMLSAPCFLNERLDLYQILSTLVIFAGAVVTVVFSSHTSPLYTLEGLKALYLRKAMIIYSAVFPTLAAAHVITIELIEMQPKERRQYGTLKRLHMIGYAGTAGLVGGQSIIFAKSTMEILKAAYNGVQGLGSSGETYLIVSAMLFCLLIQITYLNGALKEYDSLSVVPIYQAYWIVSGVVGGLVYFDEIQTFTDIQLGIFCLGIIITMTGVALLARRKSPKRTFDRMVERYDNEDPFQEELLVDKHNMMNHYAFDDFVQMTPRNSTADILVGMGVQPRKVERILGTPNRGTPLRRKELMLADMGVHPDIASKILARRASIDTDNLDQIVEEDN